MKRVYTVRSKAVHGATVKESQLEEVESAAVACDGILRATLLRILADPGAVQVFRLPAEAFDEVMLKTVFGQGGQPGIPR